MPEGWDFYVYEANSLRNAKRFLFEHSWTLLLVGKFSKEVVQLCSQLRTSEVFSHLPILGIDETLQLEDLPGAISDICSPQEPITRCAIKFCNLIRTNIMLASSEKKVAAIQEKSIHRFLLLEHIKKYISRETLTAVRKSAHLQQLNIVEKEEQITAVFTDLCKFTAMAESISPKTTINIMNKVFSTIIPIIHREDGDIDKFIGDALFAVFRSAHKAVKAVTEIFSQMNKTTSSFGETLFLHAAIHTGPVIRGNVGGDGRFDHTLIGDTVNIASRLLSLARKNEILITETCLKEANIHIPKLLRSRVRLPGKETSTTYYSTFPYLSEKYFFP